MEWINESFWMDNLRDGRNHVTLREFLATIDKDEHEAVKRAIFAHAKELPYMYDIPGQRKPLFPESWHGVFGLLWHAKTRQAWLAASKQIQAECFAASDKANDLSWKAAHESRDWRESKDYEQQAHFWRHRGYELAGEIYGRQYDAPACLI